MSYARGRESTNETLLGAVPPSTFISPPGQIKTESTPWMSQYNIAAWVFISGPARVNGMRIKLILKYWDSKGQHHILVDKGTPNDAGIVLLANIIGIQAYGRITKMTVYAQLNSQNATCQIEELYVQRKAIKQVSAPELQDIA